jgi:hypothetical protein
VFFGTQDPMGLMDGVKVELHVFSDAFSVLGPDRAAERLLSLAGGGRSLLNLQDWSLEAAERWRPVRQRLCIVRHHADEG